RTPKKIDIVIIPPWWGSTWAYFLYFLLVFGISYLVFRLIYRRKLALEESKKWQHIEEMKSEFYTNITHEFRTPLTVILGMTEQVNDSLNKSIKKACSEPLKMITRNGRKLLDLVNQLLDMAKIEDGKYKINKTKGDMVWFLGFMVENFHSYAKSKDVELIFYPEFDKLIMDYDPKVMERIISNLLGNAIKFSNKGGKVIIHLNKIDVKNTSMLQIKIKDEGIGIEKSKLPFVFDRFYQIDTSGKNKNEGTGIGLSMVKNLVELMNGSISVKSVVDKGSTFNLILPITNIAKMSNDDLKYKVPFTVDDDNVIIDSGSDDKDLVLIVEDNKDIAKYISSSISDNYSVRYAENGQSGLELAINIIPDIIISDVMMPKMDGFEMCEKLKKDIRTSHIPVIMLTARVAEEDKLKGLKYGADAYLTKPFNIEELNIRLGQLIVLRKKLLDKNKDPNNWDKIKQSKSQSIEQEFLIEIKGKIHSNIDNTALNSQFLARSMRMSDTQLYRKLKALTGKSTAIFIRSIRLRRAKELLETTNLNISEIAYDTGFNDPAYFSRVFKEEYGMSPSELRE
ncbi:MAG TPA: response regulator, partial [Bacteroidetes bacterium]|nr:response regulator [Bacteroidota bacterium]